MARKTQGDTPPRAPAREKRDSRRLAIPRPGDADFEDVHWALSAASTLWDRGEDTEALKWLRRAASAAAERDADTRAVELFKAAAEVASELDVRRRAKQNQVAASSAPPPPLEEIPVPLTIPKGPPRPAVSTAVTRPAGMPSGRLSAPQAPAAPKGQAPPSDLSKTQSDVRKTQQEPAARRPAPPRRYGTDSTIVPAVPPEPAVSEAPRALMGLRFDESEEETFVRPETLVRRALMAIDPDYARRTNYTSDYDSSDSYPDGELPSRGDSWETARESLDSASTASNGPASEQASQPRGSQSLESRSERGPASSERDGESETQRRRAESVRASIPGSVLAGHPHSGFPGALPAVRVAVLYIPEERDVRLVFLPPDAEPPPGVAVALLVPLSDEDARRLARVYADCDAKL